MSPPALISVLLLLGVASSHPAPGECARSQMAATASTEESDAMSALQSSLGGSRRSSMQLAPAASSDNYPCETNDCGCTFYPHQPGPGPCGTDECDEPGDFMQDEPGQTCKVDCAGEDCFGYAPEEGVLCIPPNENGLCISGICIKAGGGGNSGGGSTVCTDVPLVEGEVCFKVRDGKKVSHFSGTWADCGTTSTSSTTMSTSTSSTSTTTTTPAETTTSSTTTTTTTPAETTTSTTTTTPAETTTSTTTTTTPAETTTSTTTTTPAETTTSTTTTTPAETTTLSTTSCHCKPKCDYCKEICTHYRCGMKRKTCEEQCKQNFYPIKCTMKKYCKGCCKNGGCPEVSGETDLPELLSTEASEVPVSLESVAEELDEQGYCKDFTDYCKDFCKDFHGDDPVMTFKCMQRCHEDPDDLQLIFNDFCVHDVCDA